MRFLKPFTEHPAAVGETWFGHMKQASRFGVRMLVTSLASFVHAVLPFLFEETGSRAVSQLHQRMSRRNADRVSESEERSLRRTDRTR